MGDVLDPVGCRLAAGDEPEQEEHPSTGYGERDGQHDQPDDQHPQIHSFSPFSTYFLDRAAAYGQRAGPSPD